MLTVEPIVITSHPSSQQVDLEQNAKFECFAVGYNLSYQWTIGSGSFPSKVTGINTNTLVIPDVRSSDDNTYTCMASNQYEMVNASSATLTIKGMFRYCFFKLVAILVIHRFTTSKHNTITTTCRSDEYCVHYCQCQRCKCREL